MRERSSSTSRRTRSPARPATASRADEPLASIEIAGEHVAPGERKRLEIPVARLPTQTTLSLPVEVVHGSRPGPRLWISAAVHGDELNGVEIIHQVLEKLTPERLHGTVFAVPIVNVFGFVSQSRYLPDRRDLNRSFPGSSRGSLAARLAHIFMQEIVRRSAYGIDLHTGSDHRTNLPQIRGDFQNPQTRRMAEAFAAPVMMHAETRDGSLRAAAAELGIHVLLYEGGEAQRFNTEAIAAGVEGVLRVLAFLKMASRESRHRPRASLVATETTWVRARSSGICRLQVGLGDRVERGQVLALISDSFGDGTAAMRAGKGGLVIGHTNNPLVRQGDGIIHLATEFEGAPERR